MLVEDILVPGLFVSLAIGSAAGILAWRQRPDPGSKALAGLLFGQCWWSASLLFRIQATGIDAKLFWTRIAWIGVMIIPFAWLVFVLEYTGRDRYLTTPVVGVLAIGPVATALLVTLEPLHSLMNIAYYPVEGTSIGRVEQGGLWYWATAAYTYILGAAGLGLIGTLLSSNSSVFRRQGAWLLAGLIPPWITNVLFLGDIVPTIIDPTPIAFALSGVAYLIALTQHRLLDNTPAPNRRAQELLFEQFHHGAIVVDHNDHISKVNESCEKLLQVDADVALNTPAEEVLPKYDQLPDEGRLDNHITIGRRTGARSYDVVVTQITNIRGVCLGRVITFNEVTSHLRHQQRLQTLNRILRHNIRTETNVIQGYAEQLPKSDATTVIKQRAAAIANLGEKGRDAVDLFEHAHKQTAPTRLTPLLEECIDQYTEQTSAVEVSHHDEHTDTTVYVPKLLGTVIEQLVENAIVHNTADQPQIRVTTSYTARTGDTPAQATISIADNGPGIDTYELDVLQQEVETPLEHGSGLGLWITKWGISIVDGTLEFDVDESGTTVTLTVPATTGDTSNNWRGMNDPQQVPGQQYSLT